MLYVCTYKTLDVGVADQLHDVQMTELFMCLTYFL